MLFIRKRKDFISVEEWLLLPVKILFLYSFNFEFNIKEEMFRCLNKKKMDIYFNREDFIRR